MKKNFYFLFLLLYSTAYGQITSPQINANFGIEGDLKANYFNNSISLKSDDDWFKENALSGVGVIDTTGAAAILARYAIDPTFRQQPFGRTMGIIPGTVVNGRVLIDAVFFRDYHGSDSTMYASGSSKNGDSPADWNCPVAQSVPDKNEILDVMAHIRRDGTTRQDSLWLFGGVSIEQTTGDRYFDFELYQTDMGYNRATQKFYNYGPDAGHTSWKFDASGNTTQAGDVIFSASYGSSTLSSIEARIWINRSSLSITPQSFNWSGSFDGAYSGATFGYAGIVPKTAGTFYTGMENSTTEWAGPFSLVRGDNSVVTDYTPGQFMEFSVNLTKLGLDPNTLLSNIGCNVPIRRLFVKSRASTSFTAQLKDFVGPLDLFQDFKAKSAADSSIIYCGITGPTSIKVTNPIPGFNYTWTTTDGHIITNPISSSIMVDSAGTYVVTTRIYASCPAFSIDSVVVPPFNKACRVLDAEVINFSGVVSQQEALLTWSVTENDAIDHFEIERSYDGIHFTTLGIVNSRPTESEVVSYSQTYPMPIGSDDVYYRLKVVNITNHISYTKVIHLTINGGNTGVDIRIIPNPVRDYMQVSFYSPKQKNVKMSIYDASGRLMRIINANIPKGNSILNISDFQSWPDGVYSVKTVLGNDVFINKIVLNK
ncbi:MAG TPA: T9SS type A sorting domain-containing protein [Hanamia sp.]|nr:T9SS type A sorting domain-containing protein [Hanamia sp.]